MLDGGLGSDQCVVGEIEGEVVDVVFEGELGVCWWQYEIVVFGVDGWFYVDFVGLVDGLFDVCFVIFFGQLE